MVENAKNSLRSNARRRKSPPVDKTRDKTRDQPQQPLYSTLAHVFQIDPDTKKSWLPVSKQAISVSFYYDSSKFIYKVLSVDGSKVLINSTITAGMTFTRTSQKFGQWSDAKNNTVYGLGFSSEADLSKFESKFKEMKGNVKTGTPPSTPKNPVHASTLNNSTNNSTTTTATNNSTVNTSNNTNTNNTNSNNVNGSVKSGSMKSGSVKSMSTNSTGSLEDDVLSPGSHRSSSSATETQMKYENDRLKKALAQSSSNAKKWETEIQTLKNNNARLTAALQESSINVEKWKDQLNNYKEENMKLRKKLSSANNGEASSAQTRELEKSLLDTETKLKRKEEELNRLSLHSSEELHLLREKNAELNQRIQQYENDQKESAQVKNVADERSRQTKHLETKLRQVNEIRTEMDTKLKEVNALQLKMSAVCK